MCYSKNGSPNADRYTLVLFAIASAATIALGSLGLSLHGMSFGSWIRNPAAYGVGLILGAPLMLAGRTRRLSAGLVVITIGCLAATLLAPDQSGIHRWIDLGPLHVNVAALLLPSAIVALAGTAFAIPVLLTALGTISALLVAQPDASQATSFAVAAALLLWQRRELSSGMKVGGMLGLAALATVAWLRPDHLQPVPEVEGVFALLADVSPLLAAAAAVALAATSLVPLCHPSDNRTPSGSLPLASYFTVAALMPLVGTYPVPLVGLGMSVPVGYWFGVALLCARVPSTQD